MEIIFLRSMGAVLLTLLAGNVPLDVGPSTPDGWLFLGLGMLVMLGVVVGAVILVAVLVIRQIKKQRAKREHSADRGA
jgi:hypothetical protein